MNCNTIDLPQAEKSVSSLPGDKPVGYQSKTLPSRNHIRYNYLPYFPHEGFHLDNPELFANVPNNCLSSIELLRRQCGAYLIEKLLKMKNYRYGCLNGFYLTEKDAEDMATRLKVDLSIIIYNADELRGICNLVCHYHEYYRRTVLKQPDSSVKGSTTLNSKQMVETLEFFLQMDVDTFFMKTCSFRGAKPRYNSEGLFCGLHEPESRYTMQSCENLFCSCCHPYNHSKKSQRWPVVHFSSSSMHTFTNGYKSYLNCPATCNTKNIIYSMTCPCGQYEYVDSTMQSLSDVIVCK